VARSPHSIPFSPHTPQVKAELGARVDELRAANGALVRQVQDLAAAKQASDGLFTELKVRACFYVCVRLLIRSPSRHMSMQPSHPIACT
jgi:hypothetical protein